jgi:hypothetical protein
MASGDERRVKWQHEEGALVEGEAHAFLKANFPSF